MINFVYKVLDKGFCLWKIKQTLTAPMFFHFATIFIFTTFSIVLASHLRMFYRFESVKTFGPRMLSFISPSPALSNTTLG